MSSYINTRTTLGEEATLKGLIEHTLTEFIDDGVTTLRNYAFYYNTGIKNIVLPNITSLPLYAFSSCSELETIHLGIISYVYSYAIGGCSKLKAIFLESETYSEFNLHTLINGTRLGQLECCIYVPQDLVDVYRKHNNFKYMPHLFQPITSYPIADLSTVSDSWDTIISAAADGTHATKYVKGRSIKKLEYGNTFIYMQYISDRPEGPIWAVKDPNEYHRFNYPATADYNGSEIDIYVNDTLYNQFPSNIKNAIAEIPIIYWDGTSEQTINRKVWLLSSKEVGATGNYLKETNGYTFSDVLNSNDASSRRKYRTGNGYGSTTNWLTRSAYNPPTYLVGVSGNGSMTNSSATSSTQGLVYAFCLRGPSI